MPVSFEPWWITYAAIVVLMLVSYMTKGVLELLASCASMRHPSQNGSSDSVVGIAWMQWTMGGGATLRQYFGGEYGDGFRRTWAPAPCILLFYNRGTHMYSNTCSRFPRMGEQQAGND